MLADLDVVVTDGAECIAIVGAGVVGAAGSGPGGCADLKHESVSGAVPGHGALGMAPRRTFRRHGIIIELVIPQDVVTSGMINLVEGCAEWIIERKTNVISPHAKSGVGATGIGVAQGEMAVIVGRSSAKDRRSRFLALVPRKGGRVKLEYKPPLN